MGETIWDAVVVGGGSAGCVVAGRLAEDPWRHVMLIEAGPKPPEELLSSMRPLIPELDWGLADLVGQPVAQGRALGGGSAVNFAAWTRGENEDYNWGHPEWTWSSFTSAFERLNSLVPIDRALPDDPASRRLFGAAESLGLRYNKRLGSPAERGWGALPRNLMNGRRFTAAHSHLKKSPANLKIRLNNRVDRIVPGGVVVENESIRARDIILCAGACHTPLLLQQSGIGTSLPIGEGLQDHPGTFFLLKEPMGVPHEHHTAMVVTDGAHLMLFSAEIYGMQNVSGLFAFFLKPSSRGKVAPSHIDRALLYDPGDLERFLEIIDFASKLCNEAEVIMVPSPPGGIPNNLISYSHLTSTCAFGLVVDERLRVIGEEHVFVCDASVFPRIPQGGTNQATMAVAERFSELYRAEHPI